MPINGVVGTFNYGGVRASTTGHPPVFETGVVKADNGIYPAGVVLAKDGDGKLVPCEDLVAETVQGVNDAPVDTSVDTVAQYLVHGTAREDMLVKGAAATALTVADIAELKTVGIFAD
ncbi:MAG: hypothetical protein KKE73_09705 [Proteobacteria bacterium]|nr:hypothetical protein [Pseudomonadota bacterium]